MAQPLTFVPVTLESSTEVAVPAAVTQATPEIRMEMPECVNDFATPGVINLLCSVVYLFGKRPVPTTLAPVRRMVY